MCKGRPVRPEPASSAGRPPSLRRRREITRPAQVPFVHEAVVVHRLVRAVKTAHSEMDDTRRNEVAVVGWQRQPIAPVLQRPRVERLRFNLQGGRPSPGGRRRRPPAARGT